MAVKVRGGVMSTEGSTKAAATFEIDMRDLLRAKKDRASGVRQEPAGDYSSLVSQISGQSVHEIDHLIEGCARSSIMTVIAFIEKSSTMRRSASR